MYVLFKLLHMFNPSQLNILYIYLYILLRIYIYYTKKLAKLCHVRLKIICSSFLYAFTFSFICE